MHRAPGGALLCNPMPQGRFPVTTTASRLIETPRARFHTIHLWGRLGMVCNICRAQIFVRRIMDTDAYCHPWTTHDNRRYAFLPGPPPPVSKLANLLTTTPACCRKHPTSITSGEHQKRLGHRSPMRHTVHRSTGSFSVSFVAIRFCPEVTYQATIL